MTSTAPRICLITALGAEAAPLIRHFRLKPARLKAARAFEGEHCRLVQTGLGKLSAASATAAMLEAYPGTQAIINVGLCGADDPVGAVFLAHAVSDAASGRQWYPHLPAAGRHRLADSRDLLTVDTMDTTYRSATLFDMEASGVAVAATRFLDTARMQFVKCVSDNPALPAGSFDPRQAGRLMQRTLPLIDQLMQRLAGLPPMHSAVESAAGIAVLTDSLTRRVHHSVTETHALRRLLIRHLALTDRLPAEDRLEACHDAAAMHRQMHELLADADVRY